MFTIELISIYIMFFLLGSVFTTILLSHFYEIKAVEEEEKSTQNRGDQSNGLSVIKNLSTKRFFKAIASIFLVLVILIFFMLTIKYELFKHDNIVGYIIIGLFLAYVLFIDNTIVPTRVPIISMWKKGAPKRKEKRQARKEKKAAEKLEAEKELPSAFPKKPTEVKPPAKKAAIIEVEKEYDKEET